MSRYSPQVLPTSGRAFANALGQGVNTYLQTRRRKEQDDLEAAQRQRAESVQNAQLGEQGIHLMKPGELPPTFDINVTGGPNADDITNAAITGQPTPTGKPLATALSRNLSIGPGYYVDRDEQAQKAKQTADAQYASLLASALAKGQAENIVDPYARDDRHAVARSTVERNSRAPVVQQGHVVDPVTGEVKFFDPTNPPANLRVNPIPRASSTSSVGPDGVPLGKPNAENLKNAAFLDIAHAEDPALKDMGATVSSSALSRIPLIGNILLKHTDPKFQAQQLAGDRWIMQWLRSTSGAAISADELTNYRKQYIPQPGDTPETIRAKEAARGDVEKGLAKMAGAAAPRAPLPPRGQATGNVNLGDTAGKTITVNGKTFVVPE